MEQKAKDVFKLFQETLPKHITLEAGSMNDQIFTIVKSVPFIDIQDWFPKFKNEVVAVLNLSSDSKLMDLLDIASQISHTEVLAWVLELQDRLKIELPEIMAGGVIEIVISSIVITAQTWICNH